MLVRYRAGKSCVDLSTLLVFVVRCFRLVGNDSAAEGAAAGERYMKIPGGSQTNKQRLWKLISQVLQ